MIGPSSSHTAGAVKLGNIALEICGGDLTRVDFYLHGSFAKTYKGHGTGKALLGGILGLAPYDERIRDAEIIAKEKGIIYEYHLTDLGDVHPNTVKIVISTINGNDYEVVGSSIGGGNILITSINSINVEFTAKYPTIITRHLDKPGIVAKVTSILATNNVNIAFLQVFRSSKGSEASMVIETDQVMNSKVIDELARVEGINKIINISK